MTSGERCPLSEPQFAHLGRLRDLRGGPRTFLRGGPSAQGLGCGQGTGNSSHMLLDLGEPGAAGLQIRADAHGSLQTIPGAP